MATSVGSVASYSANTPIAMDSCPGRGDANAMPCLANRDAPVDVKAGPVRIGEDA